MLLNNFKCETPLTAAEVLVSSTINYCKYKGKDLKSIFQMRQTAIYQMISKKEILGI